MNGKTSYRENAGVTAHDDFAALPNSIHREWAGLTVKEHIVGATEGAGR
jgi:hypothetical protein